MKRFVSFIAFLSILLIMVQPARAEEISSTASEDAAISFTVPEIDGYGMDFECATEASQLYFIWDEAPDGWTLTAIGNDGTETGYICGENYFLHEYIRLDSPAAKFRFTFAGESELSGKVYAFGEGAPPGWVEQWEPSCDKADLLVFPARPGDEYLYFGGALPYYADKGKNIQVIYTLSGEDSDTDLHGLLSGLYRGGVRIYPVISHVATEPIDYEDERIAFYIEQIRRFKPEVVLGQDAYANYTDMSRILTCETLAVAIDISGEGTEYPDSAKKYGAWDVPKAYLHGFTDNVILMDWNVRLKSLGGKTAAEAARDAYGTQVPTGSDMSAQDFIALHSGDRFGLYRSTIGLDLIGGDFFENTSYAVPPSSPPKKPEASMMVSPESEDLLSGESGGEHAAQWAKGPDFMPIIGVAAVLCLLMAIVLSRKREI